SNRPWCSERSSWAMRSLSARRTTSTPSAPGTKTRMICPSASVCGPSTENGSPSFPSSSACARCASSRHDGARLVAGMFEFRKFVEHTGRDGGEAAHRNGNPRRTIVGLVSDLVSRFFQEEEVEQPLFLLISIAPDRNAIGVEKGLRGTRAEM